MKRLLVLAVAVVLASTALIASATHQEVRDPNDTRGKLDIRRVEIVGDAANRWVITTDRGWAVRRIFDRGFFLIHFDTFGDDHYDYYVLLRSDRLHMEGTLWRDPKNSRDRQIGTAEVSRPNRRSVKVTVPLRRMRFPDAAVNYRWHARTLFIRKGCLKKVCIDRAPNRGAVVEPMLPAP